MVSPPLIIPVNCSIHYLCADLPLQLLTFFGSVNCLRMLRRSWMCLPVILRSISERCVRYMYMCMYSTCTCTCTCLPVIHVHVHVCCVVSGQSVSVLFTNTHSIVYTSISVVWLIHVYTCTHCVQVHCHCASNAVSGLPLGRGVRGGKSMKILLGGRWG